MEALLCGLSSACSRGTKLVAFDCYVRAEFLYKPFFIWGGGERLHEKESTEREISVRRRYSPYGLSRLQLKRDGTR